MGMRYIKEAHALLLSFCWDPPLPLPSPVPAFINPVFAKTSPKRSFSVIENERFFRLVFAKTGSISSGTDVKIFGMVFRHFCRISKLAV